MSANIFGQIKRRGFPVFNVFHIKSLHDTIKTVQGKLLS